MMANGFLFLVTAILLKTIENIPLVMICSGSIVNILSTIFTSKRVYIAWKFAANYVSKQN